MAKANCGCSDHLFCSAQTRDGVSTIEIKAAWGRGNLCNATLSLVQTERPANLSLGPFFAPLDPSVVKISLYMDCPWRAQFNLSDPSVRLWGRRTKVLVRVSIQISVSDLQFIPISQAAPPPVAALDQWAVVYAMNDTVVPGTDYAPLLITPFPATQESLFAPENSARLTFPTREANATLVFNAWSLADGQYISSTLATFDARNFICTLTKRSVLLEESKPAHNLCLMQLCQSRLVFCMMLTLWPISP